MAYATIEDIEALYGAGEIAAALDAARDAALTDAQRDTVALALDSASSEIDLAIAGRYRVPLDPVPQVIRSFAIDIALWRLSLQTAVVREELSERAKLVFERLRDLAKGLGALPGHQTKADAAGAEGRIEGGSILMDARPKRFDHDGGLA